MGLSHDFLMGIVNVMTPLVPSGPPPGMNEFFLNNALVPLFMSMNNNVGHYS